VFLQTITGKRHELEVASSAMKVRASLCSRQLPGWAAWLRGAPVAWGAIPPPPARAQADDLLAAAGAQLKMEPGKFSLVLNGSSVQPGDQAVQLPPGALLTVVPRRRAPSARIQRAAEEAAGITTDPDDEPIRFHIPEGVAAAPRQQRGHWVGGGLRALQQGV